MPGLAFNAGLAVLMALSVLYFPDVIHVAFIAPFGLIVIARWVHAIRSMPAAPHTCRRSVPNCWGRLR